MRVLITGASGFVGRHTARAMERAGVRVVLTSRQSQPPYIAADLARVTTKEDFLERFGEIDYLIHLAWDGLPNYRSLHHFDQQLPLSFRFVQAAVEAGVGSVLVSGTCFEYGKCSGPVSEDLPCMPTNAYGLAKHSLYMQLNLLKESLPFNLTWARLFYVYGADQGERSLYSSLQKCIRDGTPSFAMSGGEQLRDFLPIEQAAEVLAALVLADRDIGPINVCSGKPRSVRSQVERWIADARVELALELGALPYSPNEPFAFWGNPSRLIELLGEDAITPAMTEEGRGNNFQI